MNYATEPLQIHDYLSPYGGFKNKPREYGSEDVNVGKGKAWHQTYLPFNA